MVEVIKTGLAYESSDSQFLFGSDYCNPCNNFCD